MSAPFVGVDVEAFVGVTFSSCCCSFRFVTPARPRGGTGRSRLPRWTSVLPTRLGEAELQEEHVAFGSVFFPLSASRYFIKLVGIHVVARRRFTRVRLVPIPGRLALHEGQSAPLGVFWALLRGRPIQGREGGF